MRPGTGIGMRPDQHLERVQIKRGTLFEEFLYELFTGESFVFAECESGQSTIDFTLHPVCGVARAS